MSSESTQEELRLSQEMPTRSRDFISDERISQERIDNETMLFDPSGLIDLRVQEWGGGEPPWTEIVSGLFRKKCYVPDSSG